MTEKSRKDHDKIIMQNTEADYKKLPPYEIIADSFAVGAGYPTAQALYVYFYSWLHGDYRQAKPSILVEMVKTLNKDQFGKLSNSMGKYHHSNSNAVQTLQRLSRKSNFSILTAVESTLPNQSDFDELFFYLANKRKNVEKLLMAFSKAYVPNSRSQTLQNLKCISSYLECYSNPNSWWSSMPLAKRKKMIAVGVTFFS